MKKNKEFKKRINLNVPLKYVSNLVLSQYSLGEFVSNRTIYLGYGDFSFALTTTTGKYLVKIINKETPTTLCQSIVDRYFKPSQNKNIHCPKVYTTKQNKNMMVFKIKDVEYRLFVMEYLKGNDLYSMHYELSASDLQKIAEQLAHINQVKFKPEFIYDDWAIESFNKEFKKNNKKIDENISKQIKFWKNKFDAVDFEKLPKSFIHGDVVDMNIMYNNKEFYIVDFSSANYQSRLSDVATSIADLCFVKGNLNATKTNIKLFVDAYNSVQPLNAYEKENLLTFVAIGNIIGYLNTLKFSGKYNTMVKHRYMENLNQLDKLKTLKI